MPDDTTGAPPPRPRGATRPLLGSVSQYCVTHAACPVVVVRAPATER
jgi:nucleotide-binding universal stress UspA family protein